MVTTTILHLHGQQVPYLVLTFLAMSSLTGNFEKPMWVWLKIKQEGQTAGFGPCFRLPRQAILELLGLLSHSHVKVSGKGTMTMVNNSF